MASLFFYYSAMNAGKTTALLQAAHNYEERGMKVAVLGYAGDNRAGEVMLNSRIGLTRKPDILYGDGTLIGVNTLLNIVSGYPSMYSCILVDEAQFLSSEEVEHLAVICDVYNIPVLCYGLKVDFQGKLFEGSKRLVELADKLVEMKTICHCGRKATMVLRLDGDGNVIKDGDQILIGGNESYVSVCRKHWMRGVATKQ